MTVLKPERTEDRFPAISQEQVQRQNLAAANIDSAEFANSIKRDHVLDKTSLPLPPPKTLIQKKFIQPHFPSLPLWPESLKCLQ